MKKVLLLSAVALFGAMNAQETKFGAKAGLALSSMKAKDNFGSLSYDSKASFYVGGLVEHKFGGGFAVQGEVLYADLGGKYSQDGVSDKMNIGTLSIPISAKYYVIENKLNFSAGLNFGFILSAKEKTELDLGPFGDLGIDLEDFGIEDTNTNESVKDQMNTFNISPFIGAEYNLSFGLFFDARYNFGISNMAKDTTDGQKLTMNYLQVGVGYKF